MIRPAIPARVEKPYQHAGSVDRCDVGPFTSIAEQTGKGEVAGFSQSSMLAAEHVIDFVGESRIFFVNQTVLATPAYVKAQCGTCFHFRLARIRRARALAMRSICSSSRKWLSSAV